MFTVLQSISPHISRSAGTRTVTFIRSMTSLAVNEKPVENSIRDKLTESFKPHLLEVINESNMHSVPKGSETHFKVVVVSDMFKALPPIKRHRLVNEVLQEELTTGVHALSIVTKTLKQWEDSGQKIGKSPPCMGGAGL